MKKLRIIQNILLIFMLIIFSFSIEVYAEEAEYDTGASTSFYGEYIFPEEGGEGEGREPLDPSDPEEIVLGANVEELERLPQTGGTENSIEGIMGILMIISSFSIVIVNRKKKLKVI